MSVTFASRSSPGRFLWRRPFPLLFFMLCTSTTEGLIQEEYIGCFYDDNQTSNGLSASFPPDNTLTIEKCIARCNSSNTTYAALQNGSVCHCRDVYGVQLGLPDSSCSLNCLGNGNEICGGFIGQHIAYSLYAVCPIGTYGIACENGCHCEHDIPCDRTTGRCPDGCYGNWTGSACNITSHQYIGCYMDKGSPRALEKQWSDNRKNPLQSCTKSCAENNYSYVGLQYYSQCFCGESYDKHGTSAGCNTICTGDKNTTCGGAYANSVYSVCPTGNYGKSCTGRCHCYNDKRCRYRDGSCWPSQCREGWTGTNCSIRDCTKNNGDCHLNEMCSSINLKYANVSVCRCENGFQRNIIWDNCEDIDECSLNVCDPDTMMCINTIGSYNCSCISGFQAHNATACIDIDECQQNICDNSTTDCNNTHGGYICSCKEGLWKFNDHNCMKKEHDAGANTGAIVGSIFLIIAVVAIALVLLFFYRRRDILCKSISHENISESSAKYLTQQSSHENITSGAEQQESYYANYSSIIVKDLTKLIQQKLTTPGLLDKEFKRVPMETKDPATVGKNRDLKKKNRFQNIVPYDKNRVVLSQVGGVAFSDYINASVIKGYRNTDKVIATQGPLPDTISDFWRMVCEKDVNVIVMITDLIENNKNKCAKYWPDNDESLTAKGITVKTTSEHLWNGYASRHFRVTKDSKSREVAHWHFLSYPDHGVPEDVAKFMTFLKKVRSSMLPGKCTVVHCSAGAGRTGTFIAIDYLMQQGNAGGDVDILGCLRHLRSQRPQMIQNLSQYEFVHTALLFEYTVGDTTVPCSVFAEKFAELQKRDPNTGISKLDAQLQSLESKKDHKPKEGKSRVSSKSTGKAKIAEANPTFLQGWKRKDAYVVIAVPRATDIDDFYSLTEEFNCGVVVFLDEPSGTLESLFPTKEKPIVLSSSTVHCDSSSKEAYGTCYKISELKDLDDTYANVSVYANTGEVAARTPMTVLHVTNLADTDFLECNVLTSIYNCVHRLNDSRTQRPVAIISRAGDSVSAFCLAALIAFEMISEVNEVDIYQIVQDIQKSKPQFTVSFASYKELYSVVSEYIESGLNDGSSSQEPVYDVTT